MGSDEPPEADEPNAEERRWIADLVARGQAAETDAEGRLPPGATHEIVGRRSDGTPRLRRRRTSG